MIQHTVVFRLAHEQGSAEESGFLDSAQATLTAIPGVANFVVHSQVSPKSDLRHQFSMEFADEAAYRAYNDHPEHVRFVAERWLSEVAEFQEYDFIAR